MSNFSTVAEAQAFEKQMLEISGHEKVEDVFDSIFNQSNQVVSTQHNVLTQQVQYMKDKIAAAERQEVLMKAIAIAEVDYNIKFNPQSLMFYIRAGRKALYEL